MLGIPALEDLMRCSRLRWYGHVQRSNSWINQCTTFNVPGKKPRGRPNKTWDDVVKEDLKSWKMPKNASDRVAWRSSLRRNMKSNPANGKT